MQRRIFGPKRDEITGEWRRLHNEELYDLCLSPNIIRMTKSTRPRWAWHVARMAEKPEGRNHLKDTVVCGRIVLKWIFEKWNEGPWTGLICFRIGTGGGLLGIR